MHPRLRSCSGLIVTTQCTRHASRVSVRLRARLARCDSSACMTGAEVEGDAARGQPRCIRASSRAESTCLPPLFWSCAGALAGSPAASLRHDCLAPTALPPACDPSMQVAAELELSPRSVVPGTDSRLAAQAAGQRQRDWGSWSLCGKKAVAPEKAVRSAASCLIGSSHSYARLEILMRLRTEMPDRK